MDDDVAAAPVLRLVLPGGGAAGRRVAEVVGALSALLVRSARADAERAAELEEHGRSDAAGRLRANARERAAVAELLAEHVAEAFEALDQWRVGHPGLTGVEDTARPLGWRRRLPPFAAAPPRRGSAAVLESLVLELSRTRGHLGDLSVLFAAEADGLDGVRAAERAGGARALAMAADGMDVVLARALGRETEYGRHVSVHGRYLDQVV